MITMWVSIKDCIYIYFLSSNLCKSILLFGEGNGTPLQYSCLENPTDAGAWWAAVHGVAKNQTTEPLHFHSSLSCIGEENGNPLQYSCLQNPRDGGAWWAAVYGVAQSRTRLKRLSSSSSSSMASRLYILGDCILFDFALNQKGTGAGQQLYILRKLSFVYLKRTFKC